MSDIVEVIRCKDCKSWLFDMLHASQGWKIGVCRTWTAVPERPQFSASDDYCSLAERRDANE